MQYEPVVGLEVHIETNTKTKMFCGCSSDYFGKSPNTHTCPICLGLPGALPYANKEAIDKCIQIGLALNCSISPDSLFERKNYFYPDLPKGYQISQLRWPLCVDGWLEVEDRDGNKSKIRINRVHQEEDTAKLTHQLGISNERDEKSNTTNSLVDFNRSGVPLVEIVTEPDFKDPIQVRNYAKVLQQIFRDLGVSNADMEKGEMRLEANISVRQVGQKELPNYRVELKNINSFRFMVAAVEYEIKRQIKAIEEGEVLHQETRGWDEAKQQTFLQRSKEEANDYRYFPEPDLPKLSISESHIQAIRNSKPELTLEKINRLSEQHRLPRNSLETIYFDPDRLSKFEELYSKAKDDPELLIDLTNYLSNIASSQVNQVSDDILNQLKAKKQNIMNDEDELEKFAQEVIEENPSGAVDSYKAGKEAAIGVLIGALMKKTQGKADAKIAREILIRLLKS